MFYVPSSVMKSKDFYGTLRVISQRITACPIGYRVALVPDGLERRLLISTLSSNSFSLTGGAISKATLLDYFSSFLPLVKVLVLNWQLADGDFHMRRRKKRQLVG